VTGGFDSGRYAAASLQTEGVIRLATAVGLLLS
jgi:hypothetical protein